MRKRHLEILGYRLVQVRKRPGESVGAAGGHGELHQTHEIFVFYQIPHFEWNSMELSTQDAWKEYLKRKIFKVS